MRRSTQIGGIVAICLLAPSVARSDDPPGLDPPGLGSPHFTRSQGAFAWPVERAGAELSTGAGDPQSHLPDTGASAFPADSMPIPEKTESTAARDVMLGISELLATQSARPTPSNDVPQGSEDSKVAAGQSPEPKASFGKLARPEPMDMNGMVTRTIVATGLVLGACFLILQLGKRFSRGGGILGSEGKNMRLIESLSVAPRCFVQLLQVGDNRVLVAVDAGGVKSVLPLHDSFDSTLEATESNDDSASGQVDSSIDLIHHARSMEHIDAGRSSGTP